MRLLLATTLALASAITSSAQTPTRISEVATLIEMRTDRGETYPVFNYQGVYVLGDVSLKDYNDATGIVRRELRGEEQIVQVFVSQQVPRELQLSARSCFELARATRTRSAFSVSRRNRRPNTFGSTIITPPPSDSMYQSCGSLVGSAGSATI